jgi:hypothetical protein
LARARTEKGKHYGIISAKFLAVLDALLWGFHNCHNGRCFPSYETIAERADWAQHGLRGDPRAGTRRHPHVGQPDRTHPEVGTGSVWSGAEPLACHPDQQRLCLRRSETF